MKRSTFLPTRWVTAHSIAKTNLHVRTSFFSKGSLLTFPLLTCHFFTRDTIWVALTRHSRSQFSPQNSHWRSAWTQFHPGLVACHGSDQFQTYLQTVKTVSVIPEEKTSPSVAPPHDDKHASKFANFKFRTRLKARGVPKRSVCVSCAPLMSLLQTDAQKFRKKSSENDRALSLSTEKAVQRSGGNTISMKSFLFVTSTES